MFQLIDEIFSIFYCFLITCVSKRALRKQDKRIDVNLQRVTKNFKTRPITFLERRDLYVSYIPAERIDVIRDFASIKLVKALFNVIEELRVAMNFDTTIFQPACSNLSCK